MLLTYSIMVSGKVQGVFFRQTTKEKAVALGVTGSVSNLDDGRVKIIATGTKEQLSTLVDWCRVGPPKAKVEKVEVEELPLQDIRGFTIERR
jgi:acylphosphatase